MANGGETVLQQAAISALGEIKAEDCVENILNFAQSEDWLIRQRLAESLGNFNTQKSISALKYLAKDSHSQVSQAAEYSLEKLS